MSGQKTNHFVWASIAKQMVFSLTDLDSLYFTTYVQITTYFLVY